MKTPKPLMDLDHVEKVLIKLVYAGRNPTTGQIEEAKAAIDRLRAHLQTTGGDK